MIDLTLLNQIVMIYASYYVFLFCVLAWNRSKKRKRRTRARRSTDQVPVVLVIPAHNEEDVLAETIEASLRVEHDNLFLLVMNDGSTDRTSEIARSFEHTGRVLVVDRPAEVAGRGKGAVLNHALERILAMLSGPGPLQGLDPTRVIIGVMDADGQLEPRALKHVLPLFSDPCVGGVQAGVRIANARANVLTRLQDVEFVGFSAFVQEARDSLGSVGLGGNGQFTRLSALLSLGRDPWTESLTEDLDLGLSLAELGWKVRFAPDAYVAQQGVTRFGPLLRQRTRWVQGHYQCWNHIPKLLDSEAIATHTRLDLIVYLLLVTFILVLTLGVVVNILGILGLVVTTTSFLENVPVGPIRNALHLVLSFGPLIVFIGAYQLRAQHRFRWWELPTAMLVFSAYAYVFVVSQVWALSRIALRRQSWSKTPRTEAEAAV
jgi:cellulose synthase/poly-beta-1,6-N-acetylglucosamine synthase-like glycosyltransferase